MSIDELTIVREVRPPVAAPTSEARAAAQERLYQAIAAAPAGAAPPATRHHPRRRFRLPTLGTFVAAATVLVAIAVGAVVLVSVRHGSARRVGSAYGIAAIRGAIVASGGQPLAISSQNRRSSRPTTRYVYGTTAAQVLGVAGKSGLEYEYNRYLKAGDSVRTSIDLAVQQVGDSWLAHSVSTNHGDGGAFVVMDPDNGQIIAMGSNPTYDPNVVDKRISQSTHDREFGPKRNDPWLNRAIQSEGPIGSVFAPITALAALQSGVWRADQTYDDTGEFCFPRSAPPDCLNNSGHAAYGVVNVARAIAVDDSVFFYNLGFRLNADPFSHPGGGALQQWARAFGIGQPTGIDLPDESTGTLPTPAYLRTLDKLEIECEHATGPYQGRPKHPASRGGCGLADSKYWTVGDNINLAVGQGMVQMTPLQVAVAYSAIENGGTILSPRVATAIESPTGRVLDRVAARTARRLNISPSTLSAIRTGLREGANGALSTSGDVMHGLGATVYGQTGTAQYIVNGTETDSAWYAGYVPSSETSRPIVVVVWIQRGGFGGVAAAPVARQILSQWISGRPGPAIAGSNTGF